MARSRTCIRELRCALLVALLTALRLGAAAGPVLTPQLGHPASAELVVRWNLSVYPDVGDTRRESGSARGGPSSRGILGHFQFSFVPPGAGDGS